MNPHEDALRYDDAVDLPVDADILTPCTAVANNGPASNLNRTAWLAEGGYASALNWSAGGATAHNLKRLAYYDTDGTWFGVGDGGSDFLEMSKSGGRSWTDLAASLGSGLVCVAVAVGSSATGALGQVCIITSNRAVYIGARSSWASYVFSHIDNALSAPAAGGALAYEPTARLYVACYRSGAAGMRLETSANGGTWTARALPTGWASYTGTAANPEIGVGGGRAVALYFDATDPTPLHVAYSSDCITWAGVTPTSGISSAARITRPVYDPIAGAWFFCVSTATVCEVWKSTSGGAAWAVVKTFTAGTDVEAQSAALIGPVWAILTTKGRVLVSRDQGVTWRWLANLDGTAGSWAMASGGGGALIVNASDKTTTRGGRAGRTPGAAV